jgi:hypothetical protein
VINDNDRFGFRDARTGNLTSPFSLSEIPVGVPVLGSRARKLQWTDRRLAELVRDLETGDTERWHLERNTTRQRANQAVRRGIAEIENYGPPKCWRLTGSGRALILESQDDVAETNG